jgi:hypothetical protein
MEAARAALETALCTENVEEIDLDLQCCVCFDVLLDPVALSCGHTLDQECLRRLVEADGTACPVCRKALPMELPSVNIHLRNLVHRLYPKQVQYLNAKPKKKNPSVGRGWVMWCMGECRWMSDEPDLTSRRRARRWRRRSPLKTWRSCDGAR